MVNRIVIFFVVFVVFSCNNCFIEEKQLLRPSISSSESKSNKRFIQAISYEGGGDLVNEIWLESKKSLDTNKVYLKNCCWLVIRLNTKVENGEVIVQQNVYANWGVANDRIFIELKDFLLGDIFCVIQEDTIKMDIVLKDIWEVQE